MKHTSKRNLLVLSGLLIAPFSFGFGADKTPVEPGQTLTEKLQEKADASSAKTPPEKREIMMKAIDALRASKLVEQALKKGDAMPSFELPDLNQGMVTSDALLKKGPLVVVFYRGGWCPYCNLQLHDLQENLAKIKSLGAHLAAISPQTPDSSLSTAEKNGIDFFVLSDTGNKTARRFGLVYHLPDDLINLYKGFGLDLEKSNGTNEWDLPLAATYVVSREGKIVYSFLNEDYKKRAETMDILNVLESLSEKGEMLQSQ